MASDAPSTCPYQVETLNLSEKHEYSGIAFRTRVVVRAGRLGASIVGWGGVGGGVHDASPTHAACSNSPTSHTHANQALGLGERHGRGIRVSYRRLALQLHPDKQRASGQEAAAAAPERFKQVAAGLRCPQRPGAATQSDVGWHRRGAGRGRGG